MASLKRLKIYQQVEAGKRVVNVPLADLPAVQVWLNRNGYSFKTNRGDSRADLLIEKR